MRSRLEAPRAKITFWTPSRIIFSTTIMSLLIVSGYCTIYSVMSLFIKPVAVFPTSIPWIHSESECKHTNRTWQDGKCWDYEHDMTF
ncbi:hypothetical protein IQ247_05360 [Plectonema cf. radiosum LEGE 06105]|uniref:Uncharacterized protein n=1 Tax=Plectonema cf. radiosum LEGE 06105 TaxID=945769 RepID=A0A8J7F0B9_9CYAN|nr:hypothetical protein [Plectonema radiosum]MBE9212145.1 hypothetical protein [Plectonema cf. radiosum LEGE 06105]